jgi:hypothetical protein
VRPGPHRSVFTQGTQKSIPLNYSGRGISYDTEGQNRDINVGLATVAERQAFNPISPADPDILPGVADVGAMDGPGEEDIQQGYIWDAVARAGLVFRNYGFHCDENRYGGGTNGVPLERDPFSKKLRVAFPSRVALINSTDPYFRSFDTAFPDFYREKEWERDGADHVDEHRSTAYIVGPYVKHGVVISTKYTHVNMLRTIEDVLGLDHIDVLTASEAPMTEAFDINQKEWTYHATPSIYLYNTKLPLPPLCDPAKFNQIIWEGLHPGVPYPTVRSGLDLRKNRAELLKRFRLAAHQTDVASSGVAK